MKRRLFVALPLTDSLLNIFLDYQKTLPIDAVRATKRENLHLTLAFLGYVEESHVGKIEEILAKIASSTKSFSLQYQFIALAPPQIEPRMIWGRFHINDNYEKLVNEIFANAESYITEETRIEKIPHVTIARFREGLVNKDLVLQQPQVVEPNLTIGSMILFESQPDGDGPVYLPLATFKLQGN
ncbi:MAG TPA: RNA 2',3'-cyclic phosphodiesterase [Candidatus Saccharimonadales bacterium]|nr:RNA 2',3'-cyclic phosphodiesterase [Candidatus Saccharimonadales bacterium]